MLVYSILTSRYSQDLDIGLIRLLGRDISAARRALYHLEGQIQRLTFTPDGSRGELRQPAR